MSDIRSELISAIAPILSFLKGKEITPALALILEEKFPSGSELLTTIKDLTLRGVAEDIFCTRGHPSLRFGRLLKPSEENSFSVDIVDMSCKGPGHTHPVGEVDLCFPVDPEALFDGSNKSWVVYGKNSWHEPTVTKGRMIVLYFLPNGSIQFDPRK